MRHIKIKCRINIFFLVLLFNFIQPIFTEAQVIKSIKRLSLAPDSNLQGDSYSYDPEISGDGNLVVFTSVSDNFAAAGNVAGQFHEHSYIRNILTNSTSQLDLTPDGQTGSPGQSFNTGVRTFSSSLDPHISRDGKFAAFISTESNLANDVPSNSYGTWVYLRNLETGENKRLPFSSANDPGKSETPTYIAINADGSVVVIMSIVGNINDMLCESCAWQLTVYDRSLDSTVLIDSGIIGNKFNPGISDDGRFIVFENQPGDFSAPTYSYLYDRLLNTTTALNLGQKAFSPAISGDGKYIAYSDASELSSRIKLLERESGIETVISKSITGADAAGFSDFPALSQDGRYVAFLSTANDLVAEDSNNLDDIFVFDRLQQKSILVSVSSSCNIITSTERFNTGPPSISSDGKMITFSALERLQTADIRNISGKIDPLDSNRDDDVYAVEIDFDAQPAVFRKGLKVDSPRVRLDCTGKDANIQLASIIKSAGLTQDVKIKQITQEVTISKITGNKLTTVKKITAKKNAIAAKSLRPGNYSAQVRVGANYGNGKTIYTKPSKASKFTIQN